MAASQTSLFSVHLTPDRGYAVFANAPIKKGTLLLSETPLIRIHKTHYLNHDVVTAYNKLSPSRQQRYWTLASAHGQDSSRYPDQIYFSVPEKEKKRIEEQHEARTAGEKSILSIFMTNAMECDKGAAVFEVAARFNHSCVPNAHFAWCEGLGREMIFAIKDLGVGEEITLSYCDPFYDISMRRWELQHYGFVCECIACTDIETPGSFGQQSKDRRWRLREIDDSFDVQPSADMKLKMGIEMVSLMAREGLCTPNLAHTYLQIARISADKGDMHTAVKAAKHALENYLICLGKDSEKTKNAEKSLRAFTKQLPEEKVKAAGPGTASGVMKNGVKA
ncbi:SET domain-containing protein [Tothia fuscella]|uniref:SET domain-containing protein n=1 Tax=Tothia fuscella TaxID=1048955 RepID=A0A9P4NNN8_9PEZI|nr:SET domain-containing protein [Tothia fuscella]